MCANMASNSKKGLGISDISNLLDSNDVTEKHLTVNFLTQMTAVIQISASKKMMHCCLILMITVVWVILRT